ncbi:hypothetical protein EPN96_01870 [bacterium]|nr:MAG: hypothetical protein EPN96_01870 [bacterium]
MGKSSKAKRGKGKSIGGSFAAMPENLLHSRAYAELAPSAAKILAPMIYADGVFVVHRGGADFPFTYADAKRHGLSSATFSRAIKELTAKGFITPAKHGGLRGSCKIENRFKRSERWKKYGTPEFEEVKRFDESRL